MRRLLTAVTIGATSVLVYLAASTGPVGVQREATCPVRVSDECRAIYASQGLTVARYERLKFPVFRRALSDGGVEIDMPRALARVQDCIEVRDWSDCVLAACPGTAPLVCALWDAGMPVRRAPLRSCVRAKYDAGLLCPVVSGGGDRNVYPRARAVNPAQCEAVECGVLAGEDPDEVLP